MIGRRGFLKAVGAAVVGLGLALRAPEKKPATPQALQIDAPLRKGDVFQVEGVYAINPYTHQPTPYLQSFILVDAETMQTMPVMR